MYQIEVGDQVHEAEERSDAIEIAKDLSSNTHRPVTITDEDEREHFTYKDGSLSMYRYDTPRGRRRR